MAAEPLPVIRPAAPAAPMTARPQSRSVSAAPSPVPNHCSLPPLVASTSPVPTPVLVQAPHRPSLPPRRSSGTGSPTCLKRFLRKWQQPDVRSSCGSSRTSMERCVPRDVLASQDLLDFVPICM
jgi:hypothetical protein